MIKQHAAASHGAPASATPAKHPHGPPDDVSPSELVALLSQIPRPHKKVAYPRKIPGSEEAIAEIAIVPATQQEQMLSLAAAELYTQEVLRSKKDPSRQIDSSTAGYAAIYANARTVELLSRVCFNARDPKLQSPAFPSPHWMRVNCTADEIGVLMNHYLRTQLECGPLLALMSNEECDLWIDKLVAGGRTDPLGSLSSDALIDLILRLVSHLRASRTGTSSSGGPHGSSGTTTSRSSESDSEKHEAELDDPPDVDVPDVPDPIV